MYSSWNANRNPLILPAGSLRNYGTIQKKSTTPDGFGQPQETWTNVVSAFTAIQSLSEREAFQANQFTAQVTHRITLRWLAVQISPGMRFVCGSQTYLIQTITNVEERNLVLRLMCLELNGSR